EYTSLLIGFVTVFIVTILNRKLKNPLLVMYILILTSFGVSFHLTLLTPNISNFMFITMGIIFAAFYQKKKILIFSAITSAILHFLLLILKGPEILLNSSIVHLSYFFFFTTFTFIVLLYMVTFMQRSQLKSERKESKAREDLHATKSLYESLFTCSKDAIAILNSKGNVLEVNHAFQDLYQAPANLIIQNGLQTYFTDCHEAYHHALQSVQEGKSITGLELNSVTHNGDRIIIEATISPIYNVYEKMNAISFIIRDVTEKRMLEEYMKNAEKLKITGEIAAGVAHEIRNPLTVISGFMQMLNDDNCPRSMYIDIITSEVKRMNSIISEFLLLSKPHVSNINIHNLKVILNEILLLFQSEAHYKGVTITSDCQPGTFLVYCEGNQLKQVFINLLKNSLEAMPQGGEIVIQCAVHNTETIQVLIKDNGMGIPKEVLQQIWKPFFTTKEEGTGLGLLITERIIKQHHGSITITSELGNGTTVDISLPIYKKQDVTFFSKSTVG
ncbi:ATP-binding protein, partial [Bacillus sp. JJ722]|uniref:ATP-binding protein n=1 Tax=Bacillus sp. JJ722 TaxID=3122973 RepID=UPI002FFD6EB1